MPSSRDNISRVVLGQTEVVRLTAPSPCWAGEHILLEDVPGVGKTLVGKAVARSLASEFRRIQFTPDLLPGDITGSSIYSAESRQFAFSAGPIFANVVLADETDWATPRTQAALWKPWMSGRFPSMAKPSALLRPCMVIAATQNPVEFEGTYPLPESQLDRFLLRIPMGYPSREVELQVLSSHRNGEPVDSLQPAIDCREVIELQEAVRKVAVDTALNGYLLEIVLATRKCEELHVGASTRGALALYRAAQAAALIAGREYVVPDDIKTLAVPVLAHRVIPKGYLHGGQRQAVESLVERLVEEVPVPG